MALGAGHCFIVFLGEGYYPVNVLNAIKMLPEVCRIFCATANPVEVVVAETEQERGLLDVIDGLTIAGADDRDQLGGLGFVRTTTLKAFPETAYHEIIRSMG